MITSNSKKQAYIKPTITSHLIASADILANSYDNWANDISWGTIPNGGIE